MMQIDLFFLCRTVPKYGQIIWTFTSFPTVMMMLAGSKPLNNTTMEVYMRQRKRVEY